MMVISTFNYRRIASVKKRFFRRWVLSTVALLMSAIVLPVRAGQVVADGIVNFSGVMLGAPTCTLENRQLAVDFGTINITQVGGVLPDPLVPPREVVFRLTNCAASVKSVRMAVTYQETDKESYHIANAGTATGVAGQLACSSKDPDCWPGSHIYSGGSLIRTVQDGSVSFPLEVSLVAPDSAGRPVGGSVDMTVNFVFEED
ncbi:type 1 fimbrial protein [Salmonella enterica]|nr:type 1 fimbrial protein [Salmonella enterica]